MKGKVTSKNISKENDERDTYVVELHVDGADVDCPDGRHGKESVIPGTRVHSPLVHSEQTRQPASYPRLYGEETPCEQTNGQMVKASCVINAVFSSELRNHLSAHNFVQDFHSLQTDAVVLRRHTN